jgi:glycosyltransferase involved in cell wall biosynthesis
MKIAQIVCVYPPYKSGISTSALATARVFSSAGHEVETFTIDYVFSSTQPSTHPVSRGAVYPPQEGIFRLRAFPKFGNGGFLPQLFWRLKDFDFVYLHYPFFGAAEIIWFLKKFFWKNKTKLIIHFHMEPEFTSPLLKILSWPSRLIRVSLFKQADLIICASLDYVEANMPAGIFSVNRSKIKEIPFSVDTERFKPLDLLQSSFDKLGTGDGVNRDGVFKILFVGGLDKAHYFKGVEVLFNALNLLSKNNSNWQLEIVGSGDLQAQYENQARELGIADKVIFVGNVNDADLPKKYQQADCLVLPSVNKGEAFGIVLLDAMATGIPVIASDLPGVRRVFTEASGLKVKPGDEEDLQKKIKFLMDNPEKRAEMGKAARRETEEKYDQDVISNKLKEVLVAL